jgi:hypothetical protein
MSIELNSNLNAVELPQAEFNPFAGVTGAAKQKLRVRTWMLALLPVVSLVTSLTMTKDVSPSTVPHVGERAKPPAQVRKSAPLPLVGNLQAVAAQVLADHANKLQTTYATSQEWQGFLADIYSTNPKFKALSADQRVALRDAFTSGRVRPKVRFVAPEVLTDAQGQTRTAAFVQNSQTILLANNLDRAGIKEGIEQELGHWWDVQLNGATDTTTGAGKAFDEGEAYAERFSAGALGNVSYSQAVYQDDHYKVFLDGQETPVEFRKIASWNIQQATAQGQSVYPEIFAVMNDQNIDVMAIQEAGRPQDNNVIPEFTAATPNGRRDFPPIESNGVFIGEYEARLNDSTFRIYWILGSINSQGRNLAIVLRNPTGAIRPIFVRNPRSPQNIALDSARPALGVRIEADYYFTAHAQAFGGTGNDANLLANATRAAAQADLRRPARVLTLMDGNRDLTPGVGTAFPAGQLDTGLRVIAPNAPTFDARAANPGRRLDYLITNSELGAGLPLGTVLNTLTNARTPAFPSDHFPVVYEDFRPAFSTFETVPSGPGPTFPGGSQVDGNTPQDEADKKAAAEARARAEAEQRERDRAEAEQRERDRRERAELPDFPACLFDIFRDPSPFRCSRR